MRRRSGRARRTCLRCSCGREFPAPTALRLVGPSTGSRWLCETLDRLAEAAEKGRPLSVAGREDRDVPARFNYALDIGERRGDLAAAMSALAERYRYDARRRSQLLIRYLPPGVRGAFRHHRLPDGAGVLGPYYRVLGRQLVMSSIRRSAFVMVDAVLALALVVATVFVCLAFFRSEVRELRSTQDEFAALLIAESEIERLHTLLV